MSRPHVPAFRPALALLLAATLAMGCSLLKKKKDAGAEDEVPVANAPTVTVTGTGAKNEKDVLRYANEQKIDNETATIGKDVTKVRTFPGSGGEVATLSKGVSVVKLAKFFSTGVLILFDDPGTADGTKLMGWIAPESLAAPGGTATAPVAVNPAFTAPRVALVDGGLPKDGGVALVPDAGVAVAVADAGAAAIAAVDAGAAAVAALGPLQITPVAGRCPPGFALMGPFCRRPCAADANCPKGTFCTLGAAGRKSCSATK